MRRKRILTVSSIVAFLVYALLTGGISLSSSRDFGGQRDVTLVEGLRSDLWLHPEYSDWHIPLVFHYYGYFGPYGLRIQIWDPSKTFTALEVDGITVVYAGGERAAHRDGWGLPLEEYAQTNSSSSGIVETEMLMLSETIPDIGTSHESATITITGRLLKKDAPPVDFSTTEYFEAESDLRLTTFWQVLDGI